MPLLFSILNLVVLFLEYVEERSIIIKIYNKYFESLWLWYVTSLLAQEDTLNICEFTKFFWNVILANVKGLLYIFAFNFFSNLK